MRYSQVVSMNSFSNTPILKLRLDPFSAFRSQSRGYIRDRPAIVHPNIMFGAGCMLTEEFVEQNNISHVINCAFPVDCPDWAQTYFKDKYICLEAIDNFHVNITEWYPKFQFFMDQFLKENDCTCVYVHCQAGINRSGFLTVLYCCVKLSYSLIPTCKAIISQRPCALTNYVFFQQVRDYIAKNIGKE